MVSMNPLMVSDLFLGDESDAPDADPPIDIP